MDGECPLERGLCGSVLRNFNRREEQEDSDEGQLWYTKTVLSGPKGYNCEATACLALEGMESRPHKQNIALRKAGVMQYRFDYDCKVKKRRSSTISELEHSAEIEAGDRQSLIDHFQSRSSSVNEASKRDVASVDAVSAMQMGQRVPAQPTISRDVIARLNLETAAAAAARVPNALPSAALPAVAAPESVAAGVSADAAALIAAAPPVGGVGCVGAPGVAPGGGGGGGVGVAPGGGVGGVGAPGVAPGGGGGGVAPGGGGDDVDQLKGGGEAQRRPSLRRCRTLGAR